MFGSVKICTLFSTILKQSLLGSVNWNGIVPWHGNESGSPRPCSEKELDS